MTLYGPNEQCLPDFTPPIVKSLSDDDSAENSAVAQVNGNKMIISHKYNDMASVTEDEAIKMFLPQGSSGLNEDDKDMKKTKKRRNYKKAPGGVAEAFPLKLHRMLDTVEAQGLSHIVSWRPHGRAFLVHDPKAFVDAVLPQFSKQKKISSFHRQLQLYGFMRITRGPDSGAYYHERFLIGRPYLCRNMYRTKVKGLFQKPIIDPNTEPNFYKMPHLKRLPNTGKLPSFEVSPGPAGSCDSATAIMAHKREERPIKPESSKQMSHSVHSSRRSTKLIQMATTHLRTMRPSKQLSSLSNHNFDRIEPLAWSPLCSNDDSPFLPIKEQQGSDGRDLSELSLSTASILQRFLMDN